MTEDWEQVTPFLQDMQHCADDDYFSPQEVSVESTMFGAWFVFVFVICLFCCIFAIVVVVVDVVDIIRSIICVCTRFFFNCRTYSKNA